MRWRAWRGLSDLNEGGWQEIGRVQPGGVDLNKLGMVDSIADEVLDGKIDFTLGHTKLNDVIAAPGILFVSSP